MTIKVKCSAESLVVLNAHIAAFALKKCMYYKPSEWFTVCFTDNEKPPGMFLEPEGKRQRLKERLVNGMFGTFKCFPRLTLIKNRLELKLICDTTLFAHYQGVPTEYLK